MPCGQPGQHTYSKSNPRSNAECGCSRILHGSRLGLPLLSTAPSNATEHNYHSEHTPKRHCGSRRTQGTVCCESTPLMKALATSHLMLLMQLSRHWLGNFSPSGQSPRCLHMYSSITKQRRLGSMSPSSCSSRAAAAEANTGSSITPSPAYHLPTYLPYSKAWSTSSMWQKQTDTRNTERNISRCSTSLSMYTAREKGL